MSLTLTQTRDNLSKIDLPEAALAYSNGIVHVRIKEGADLTLKVMQNIIAAREKLIDDQPFTVLVDARATHNSDKSARQYVANYDNACFSALAIVNTNNLASRIIINVFLKYENPKVPSKVFKNEEDATKWLRDMLRRSLA